jgi:hypothetical protein
MSSWAEWSHVLTDAVYSAAFMFILSWVLNQRDEDSPGRNLRLFIAAFYFGLCTV